MAETVTTARLIACAGCGASFTIARPEPEVDCPFCSLHQPVPAQLLAELREFREKFAHQQVAADAAVATKADWDATTASVGTWGQFGIALFVAAQALPILLALAAYKLLGDSFPAAPVAIGLYLFMYGGLDFFWRVRSLGLWFYSVRTTVGPYHALIELNLKPLHLQPPSVHVLLAAWIPGVSDADEAALPPQSTDPLQTCRERLSGWLLETTPAGLVARMKVDGGEIERFIRNPESATALTGALAQLGACAQAIDAL